MLPSNGVLTSDGTLFNEVFSLDHKCRLRNYVNAAFQWPKEGRVIASHLLPSCRVLLELGLDGCLGEAVGERVLEPPELFVPGQEVFR